MSTKPLSATKLEDALAAVLQEGSLTPEAGGHVVDGVRPHLVATPPSSAALAAGLAAAVADRDRPVVGGPRGRGGRTVMNVNPAGIDQYRLPLASAGILVAAVGGQASRSGLRPGDLILALDGRDVGDVDALEAAARRSGAFVLRVERKGRRGHIAIRV